MSENRGAEFEASVQREAQGRSRSRNVSVLRQLVPFLAPYKGMIALATIFLLAAAGASRGGSFAWTLQARMYLLF